MLQGKKICMVKAYFIIRNIEITNKDFTSSIISVSYDAFASSFRKNIPLERILESVFWVNAVATAAIVALSTRGCS